MAKLQRAWGSFHAQIALGSIYIHLLERDSVVTQAEITAGDARAIAAMLNQAADQADQDKETL